jgi:SAM-dependent methyltransferase
MRYFFFTFLILFSLACKDRDAKDTIDYNSPLSENIGRSSWQKPNLIIDKLGDLSDKTVADIGAGSGFFSFRLAFKAKKVIAIDIDPAMIEIIELQKDNLPLELTSKIETRLVAPEDPKLIKGEADVVVLINTVAYIKNLKEYFTTLGDECVESNKILIVDFKEKTPEAGFTQGVKSINPNTVKEVLTGSGFDVELVDSQTLEYQYIIIATKR